VDAQQGGPLFPNLLFSGFFIDKYPWNATLHAFKQFFFFFGKHLSINSLYDRYEKQYSDVTVLTRSYNDRSKDKELTDIAMADPRVDGVLMELMFGITLGTDCEDIADFIIAGQKARKRVFLFNNSAEGHNQRSVMMQLIEYLRNNLTPEQLANPNLFIIPTNYGTFERKPDCRWFGEGSTVEATIKFLKSQPEWVNI
jgi:hypothetical protein